MSAWYSSPGKDEVLFKGSKVDLVRASSAWKAYRGCKNRIGIRMKSGLVYALSDRISDLFLEILEQRQ